MFRYISKIVRSYPFILLLTTGVLLSLELFAFRGVYMESFNKEYMYDLYEHSQWMIGKSIRTISDEALYQIAGYDLVTTHEFYKINREVPPLGKYLYGISILLFNNPAIISILLFLTALFAFYKISTVLFAKKIYQYLSVLLFCVDPLLFSQAKLSMLDLPLLIALLFHILALLKLATSKNHIQYRYILLAGVSLGAFLSIKFGVLAAAILVADFFVLYRIKKLRDGLYVLLIAGVTYLLTHIVYFLQGNSFVDFIKAQLWMVDFYFSSEAKPVIGTVFTTLLFGSTKGWSEDTAFWTRVAEWNILWPLYAIYSGILLYRLYKHKEKSLTKQYMLILTLGLLAMYMFVPFFTRYLVLVIPLLILLTVYFIEKLNFSKRTTQLATIIIFIIFAIQYILFLFPSPRQTMQHAMNQWELGIYQDFYSNFDKESQRSIDRYEYWRRMQVFEKNMQLKSKDIMFDLPATYPWENQKSVPIKIKYHTSVGTVTHNTTLELIREDNIWKIDWDPSLVLNNWNYDTKILTSTKEGEYGRLMFEDGTIVSEGKEWPLFYVTPSKIKNEEEMLDQLFNLTQIDKQYIQRLYKANNQPDWSVEIEYLHPRWPETYIESFQLDPGISVTKDITRVYNDRFTQDDKLEHIIRIEEQYADQLNPQTGGTIHLINKEKKQLLISTPAVNGKDVIVTSPF